MTNFGPWEFIFRWLFALPFMGFKPLNSTKIYLAESEHYTIVHNIRMLTDWTRCTNFRFGLLFFLLKNNRHASSQPFEMWKIIKTDILRMVTLQFFLIISFLLLSSRSSNIIDLRIFACMQLYTCELMQALHLNF